MAQADIGTQTAAVSTDYYVRLEQGRERHPSQQVLDALAGVLLLEAEAAEYLRGLAADATSPRGPGSAGAVECAAVISEPSLFDR